MYRWEVNAKAVFDLSLDKFIKPDTRQPLANARLVLKIDSVQKSVCVRACVCACLPPRLSITSGMIWTPYD